jgi:2-polyprenyl-3-methyl-5-hydroxy-6-metoxy-1,4-benzoquinol methylase
METVLCNLCNCNNNKIRYIVRDILLDRPQNKYSFVQCERCGLIFQNPRPSLVEMASHYPETYVPYQVNSKEQPFLLRRAYQYGYRSRARYISDYKKNGTLLDVGCSNGEFLEYMKSQRGWEVSGVEISQYAAQVAKSKGLTIFTGTLEKAAFPKASFDVVTLWDVLEHIHDPRSTLTEIRRILRPGGLLTFRVPNGDSFDSVLFGQFWAGLDAPRHLYVYTHETIRHLLAETGFKIRRMNTRQGSYIGFVLSIDFWMKASGVRYQKQITQTLLGPIFRIVTAPVFYFYSLTQRATQLTVTAEAE